MSPPADAGSLPSRSVSRALTLHLGVLVQPYRSRSGKAGALTTADVARFLEDKYGIMQAFYRVHGQDVIAKALEESIGGALESLLMGQRVDPFGGGMQIIQAAFKRFISSREVERIGIPGVPTKAALRGVNHRLKHPYTKRNARRPSFRDTGLYMADFRTWID